MALSDNDKAYLLKLARQSIEDFIGKNKERSAEVIKIKEPNSAINEKRGAFVTLKSGEYLRGCIGTFSEEKPLYKTVIEMAVSAAAKDPRFMPVTIEELKGLTIEISALTPLEQIEDAGVIEIGRHGIYITKGHCSGVLLPQVATENGMDRSEFLEAVCQKAGLGPGEWKEGATISTFEAEIFSEKE